MIGATDWVGISAAIGALSAAIVAVIGALATFQTKRQIQTGNGRSIGESVSDARAVAHDTNEKVTTIRDGAPPIVAEPLPPAS